jgi:phage-related protein
VARQAKPLKPVHFIGSSRKDLKSLPPEARYVFGYAIFVAQRGGKHPDAKPLKGFGGAGVLEVVEDADGNTYRAVYTVKFADVLYFLHAFQKKSKAGSKTPPLDMEKITRRLKDAEAHYREHYASKSKR